MGSVRHQFEPDPPLALASGAVSPSGVTRDGQRVVEVDPEERGGELCVDPARVHCASGYTHISPRRQSVSRWLGWSGPASRAALFEPWRVTAPQVPRACDRGPCHPGATTEVDVRFVQIGRSSVYGTERERDADSKRVPRLGVPLERSRRSVAGPKWSHWMTSAARSAGFIAILVVPTLLWCAGGATRSEWFHEPSTLAMRSGERIRITRSWRPTRRRC